MIPRRRSGPRIPRRDAIVGAVVGALLPGVRVGMAQAGRAQPSPVPMLLPETSGHLGAVRAVAVTIDGALIATGGVDRSVRLWHGETLLQLWVWRPPLGEGEVGVVDALEFSDNGQWLFVAAVDWVGPKGIVYVVDTRTGVIRRVIASGATRTNRYPRLAASPNGGDLALASEKQGLVVMRVGADLATSVTFNDRVNSADPTVAVAISADGSTIASASQQGVLRLFTAGAAIVEQPPPLRRPLPGEPISLGFSADGRRIAVGFTNQRGVAVVDRPSGQIATLEPPASFNAGNVGAVAWAFGDDGAEWLFAGGTIQQPGGGNLVFAWRNGRPSIPLSVEVAQDSLSDLAAHPKGGVVFGSSDGGWGRVTTAHSGRRLDVVLTPSERLDFREVGRRRWSVDRSGGVVEFQGLQRGQPALRFDVAALRLDEFGARVPRPDLRPARAMNSTGITAAALRRGEHVRSSDAGLNAGRILVGTDEAILLFDAAGLEIGRRSVATPAWGCALSGDGRVALAAHGDGTIRWYGLSPDAPLHELGGLFVHVDRKRWVAWRNDGHFAYSELGGDTLVGLHVNGRYDSADPAALTSRWSLIDQQFRTLYDPEAVGALLRMGPHWQDGRETTTARVPADPPPFPDLRIVQLCATADLPGPARRTRAADVLAGVPDSGGLPDGVCQTMAVNAGSIQVSAAATAVRVRLDFGSTSGAVYLDAFVNGVNVGRSLHPPGSLVEALVPLPLREARIEFRAYGPTGAFSRTPSLVVTREQQAPGMAKPKPTLHVLALGIDRYAGTVPALRYAVSDAMTFARTLERVAPDAYAGVAPPIVLPNEAATLEAAQNAMLTLAERATPDDAVVIYMAGHGVSTEGEYAFVTANVRDVRAAAKGEGCLRAESLITLLSTVRASRSLLMLDTCYANALDLQLGGRLGHESGRYVLTASGYDQQALDGYDDVNGVFGYAVKEALTKLVPASSGVLDALELCRHVRDQVESLAKERGHGQRAHFQAAGDLLPFPLAQSR